MHAFARVIAAVVLLTASSQALYLASAADEPRFLGRTLEQWVRELDATAPEQRSYAGWAIGQFAVEQTTADNAMPWLNVLCLLTEDDSSSVRYWGALSLGRFMHKLDVGHPAQATAASALKELLEDRSLAARVAAAESLAGSRVGASDSAAALKVLTDALQNPQDAVRIQAVSALERLGAAARSAEPALRAAKDDISEYVKRISTRALRRLDGEKK